VNMMVFSLLPVLPCSENPIEPNIAGFSDCLWSQISGMDNFAMRRESNQ
jgi:hypothetical protein